MLNNDCKKILEKLSSAEKKDYRALPFWSWNDKLCPDELIRQINRMKEQGFGGFFMHARGGLKTEYLSDEWFDCVKACVKEAEKLGMECWAYDENGWPSGFADGELLKEEKYKDCYLDYSTGEFDTDADVNYVIEGKRIVRVNHKEEGKEYLNVTIKRSVSTADVLSGAAVDKFIEFTHEKYKDKLGEENFAGLAGFFTDEPQYYRWAQPFTFELAEYFAKEYGENIYDDLGLLFAEKEGYEQFRYKYWKAMQNLMVSNFCKKIYGWCEKNGKKLTGHYIEEKFLLSQMKCCAGIMPAYAFQHIPGMDSMGRKIGSPVAPKQVSSVARQYGRKRVLTETFAMCGWDVIPRELKRIAEWQIVNGVTVLCQHLVPYSETGQRKRDYPAHFSVVNPWVKRDFRSFNDYFANLGYLIGESEHFANVALFCPIRSLYLDYKYDGENKKPLSYQQSYIELAEFFTKNGIGYDIIDESVLKEIGSVKDGKLHVGKRRYDYVAFPNVSVMDQSTCDLLERLYSQGGKMLFTGEFPRLSEGMPYEFNFKTNVDIKAIKNSQPFRIDNPDTQISYFYGTYFGNDFIYCVNLSETESYEVTFSGKFRSFVFVDMLTFKSELISTRVKFKPCDSFVLFLSDKEAKIKEDKKRFTLPEKAEIVGSSDNFLLLDDIRYSFDGKNYSDKVSCRGAFDELLKSRYDGKLYLKYEFFVKDVVSTISLVTEYDNPISCTVNGKKIKISGEWEFEKNFCKTDVTRFVKKGENEIVFCINFYQRSEIYYALYGEGVTETLKNKVAFDSVVEACYLEGDFGVYAKDGFENGKTPGVFIGKDFYISKKNKIVGNTVTEGYPFFAGKMTFKTEFVFDKSAPVLKLDGRFALAYIKLNGKFIETPYFDNEVDLTGLAEEGKNQIEITLYSGNRNLFGPHRYAPEEECTSVSPYTFDLTDSFVNAKSPLERKDYTFVRFGLFPLNKQ